MDEKDLLSRAAFDAMDRVEVRDAGLNLVNSLGAAQDVVRWRKQPRTLTERLLNSITGRERQLDRLFDAHTSVALDNLYRLAADIREHVTQSDIALAKTARKLRQVSDSLAAFKEEVPRELERIAELLSDVAGDVALLKSDVRKLNAQSEVDRAMLRLQDRLETQPPTMADLWDVVDGLWWGDFGALMRAAPDDARSIEIRDHLFLSLRRELKAHGLAELMVMQPLLDAVPAAAAEERPMIELRGLDPDWALRPLTRAILLRRMGEKPDKGEAAAVPRVTSTARLLERLLEESRRGTEL